MKTVTRVRLRGHFHTENVEDREERMRPQRWHWQTGHIDRNVVTSQLRLVVEICDREKGKLGWDPQGRSAWWCIWDQRSHRSFGRSLPTWVNPWRFENQEQPSPGRKLVQIVSKRKNQGDISPSCHGLPGDSVLCIWQKWHSFPGTTRGKRAYAGDRQCSSVIRFSKDQNLWQIKKCYSFEW